MCHPTLPGSEQRRLLDTISTLDFHRQNVANIDAAVHALAAHGRTLPELAKFLAMPNVVLSQQMAWFGTQGFQCLRYLGRLHQEIFAYITDGFQSLDHRLSYRTAKEQVMQTHSMLAQVANGRQLSEALRGWRWGSRIGFATANLRTAMYCTRIIDCIQELGIERSTFHHVMANAQMGLSLERSFLGLGIPKVLHATRFPPASMVCSSFAGCFGSGSWSSYPSSHYASTCGSEYDHSCSESFNSSFTSFGSDCQPQNQLQNQSQNQSQYQHQGQAIPTINVQCDDIMVDAFDDETRAVYEWKFIGEAQQAYYEQAQILHGAGLLGL